MIWSLWKSCDNYFKVNLTLSYTSGVVVAFQGLMLSYTSGVVVVFQGLMLPYTSGVVVVFQELQHLLVLSWKKELNELYQLKSSLPQALNP